MTSQSAPEVVSGRAVPVLSGARPVLGHVGSFLRDPEALLRRGYAEHGPVFGIRLGRSPVTVLLGNEYNRAVFSETDRRLSIRAAYPFFGWMFDRDFFILAEFEEYRRQRELILPRFRGDQLDGYVDIMATETNRLIDRMGDRGELELVGAVGELVARIAAHAFLGPDLGNRITGFLRLFRQFSDGMNAFLPDWVPRPGLFRGRRARDQLRVQLLRLIEQRRRQPVDPPDFLQVLAEARFDDGEPVPDLLVINLILLLTWAGQETTTGQLAWALTDLLGHPTELARVRAEQAAQLPADQPLTASGLRALAHLDNALHESERLHPVAYVLLRQATEPLAIGGYHLPRGGRVLISPALSHRLPEQYPEPDAYRPDRFTPGGVPKHSLIGFGGGVHRCLGSHFAYLEMRVVVTMLLRHYELELLDEPVPVRGAGTKWPQSPCRVRYRARTQPPRAGSAAG